MLFFKRLLFLSFIFISGNISGQSFSYPKILSEGKTVADFIPADWKIVDSAKDNRNHNQCKEYAFVIQYKDSVTIRNKEEDKP
jgi:hypothetical protein